MQFRNNLDIPQTITVRLNKGEVLEGVDPVTGETRTRTAPPRLHTVHVPAEATVEIDDEIWNAAWKARSKVELYETLVEEIPTLTGKKLSRKVYQKTGKTEVRYPLQVKVANGDFTIVENTAMELTVPELRDALKEIGVSVSNDLRKQELEDLYRRLVL